MSSFQKNRTMSKAEKFISDCTRNCSNQYDLPECFENGIERLKEYQSWLTPDQARKAVEIAREEMIEKVTNYLNSKLYDWVKISHFGRREYPDTIMKRDFIYDLKQAMKDE